MSELTRLLDAERYSEVVEMVSKYVALLYLDEARTALIVKQLKSTQPPSETASKLAYYHCLSKCFDILQDVPSKSSADFNQKAENLVEFANVCSEKGYLTQGIMALEKVITCMKDYKERELLVSWLQELKNERHIQYVALHKDKVGHISQIPKAGTIVQITTTAQAITSKYRSVRMAEAELQQRRQQRLRKTPYSQ